MDFPRTCDTAVKSVNGVKHRKVGEIPPDLHDSRQVRQRCQREKYLHPARDYGTMDHYYKKKGM